MDNNRLPESIVVKLFDQVKHANDQNTESVKDLTRVVAELTKCIEKQPDMNDMAQMCINRGHDVNDLKETAHDTNNMVKSLKSRVGIMILTVLITFAIMTTSYFFVRNSVENMIDKRVDEIHKVLEVEEGD